MPVSNIREIFSGEIFNKEEYGKLVRSLKIIED
jgi:hypothetical protein